MIYDEQNSPNGKACWTLLYGRAQQVKVQSVLYLPGDISVKISDLDGSHEKIIFHSGMQFSDTREELLVHLISRQQKIITDAEVEIERLQGMREVPIVGNNMRGRKAIQDEFTDLPVSRQRKAQLRNQRDGKCRICSSPRIFKCGLCEKHYIQNCVNSRESNRKRFGWVGRYKSKYQP